MCYSQCNYLQKHESTVIILKRSPYGTCLKVFKKGKKMKKKNILKTQIAHLTILILLVFVSMCCIGCATTIPVEIQRPAELELNGAKTIAVLPISTSGSSAGEF